MSTETKLPQSWEEFCQMTGRDPNALPDVSAYDDRDKAHAIADFKLTLIIRYCNGDVLPDYGDRNQVKYEPWFEVIKDESRPSGFGLSCNDCDGWFAITSVGVRLCFLSVEVLRHVVKYFIDLYCDLNLY